jgi:hypothetical protein
VSGKIIVDVLGNEIMLVRQSERLARGINVFRARFPWPL